MTAIARIRSRYSERAEPQRTERRLELVFFALILLVILQMAWWMWSRAGDVAVTAVLPTKDSLQVIETSVTGAITAPQSLQLQARPLFWASRRPSAGNSIATRVRPENGKPSAGLKDLQVAGALGAGDQGQAIVLYKEKLMRLGIGDEVAGWSLQSVSMGEVVFVSGGARDAMRLSPLPIVAGAPAAPAASAPASGGAVSACRRRSYDVVRQHPTPQQ